MKIFKIVLTLALLFTANFTFSQELNIDFGKVDKSDLEMTVYHPDSSASAVVLYDYGHSYFSFDKQDYSFLLTFETHIRIKILKKDGLSRGTFKINLYHNQGEEEKVNVIKGYTFNLEGGKIVRSKLKSKNKFEQETDSRNTEITVTFPNVKVGSIIDFKYIKTSDFKYTLENWAFQSSIPVVWSEYQVEIPEYYNYFKNNKGYIAPYIFEESASNKHHNISTKNRKTRGYYTATNTAFSNQTVEYKENVYRFVYKDVPAFEVENYIGTPKDYLSQVSFELQSTKFPNGIAHNYSSDYASIGHKLLDSERFGLQLDKTRFLRKEIELIKSTYTDPKERMQAAYNWVQNNIKWDGYNSLYAENSIKDVYKEKEGRAGGVNLLLTTFLRALDINAYPVALSTRSNGVLPITFPSITSFNYTIAYAKIGGKEYLLDATEKNLPINILPSRCLNGKGRIISENGGKWIALNSNTKYFKSEMIKASINSDGEFVGRRKIISKNYAAFLKRNTIDEDGGVEKYFETYTDDDVDFTLDNYSVDKLENIYSPLVEKMDISLQVMDDEDIVYFNPLLYFKVEENPFVQEKRIYPVDFNYPTQQKYMLQMEIPEGYNVAEIPEKVFVSLPGKAGKFTYQVIQNGKNILVISQININKQLFLPNEYQVLKQFYKLIVDKHSQVIVFKKIEA